MPMMEAVGLFMASETLIEKTTTTFFVFYKDNVGWIRCAGHFRSQAPGLVLLN